MELKKHLVGLQKHGPSRFHRKTFKKMYKKLIYLFFK